MLRLTRSLRIGGLCSLALLPLLSSCGHSRHGTAATGSTSTAAAAQAPSPASASPSDTPSCGAAFDIPVKGPQAPVDDIRGLRLGVTLDEAVRYLECLDRSAQHVHGFDTNGVAMQYFDRTVRTQVDIITGTLKPPADVAAGKPYYGTQSMSANFQRLAGQANAGTGRRSGSINISLFSQVSERFTLSSLGEAGQERVLGIWQAQYFPDGANPTRSNWIESLKSKYGQPDEVQSDRLQTQLFWRWDPAGRHMGTSDARYHQCNISLWIGQASGASSGCGLTIGARIAARTDNTELVKDVTVGVTDQAAFMNTAEVLEARWKAQDDQRKRDAVERAKSGQAPKL